MPGAGMAWSLQALRRALTLPGMQGEVHIHLLKPRPGGISLMCSRMQSFTKRLALLSLILNSE